jgi:hypothetical protein
MANARKKELNADQEALLKRLVCTGQKICRLVTMLQDWAERFNVMDSEVLRYGLGLWARSRIAKAAADELVMLVEATEEHPEFTLMVATIAGSPAIDVYMRQEEHLTRTPIPLLWVTEGGEVVGLLRPRKRALEAV